MAKATAEEILDAWNEMAVQCGVRPARGFTDKRRAQLRARVRDPAWEQDWREALAMIPDSEFLCGHVKPWRASLDWFLQSESVIWLLEGKYTESHGEPESTPNYKIAEKALKRLDTKRIAEAQ